MRTKALLLAAAISAVGLATSMAQVYSVNIVGYVNVTILHGYSIIANPLNASPDNTIASVIANPPIPIRVFKYVNATGQFLANNFDVDFGWDDPAMPVEPGEGLFVFNDGTNFNWTFVGEVPIGTVSVPLYQGFNLVASKIPQSGLLQTDLLYPPSPTGDVVYKYVNATGQYAQFIYDPDFQAWDPEPTLNVAEGCYILRSQTGTVQWTRTFTVN
jgi:hypothetical protein